MALGTTDMLHAHGQKLTPYRRASLHRSFVSSLIHQIDLAAIEIEYTCRCVKQPRIQLFNAMSISTKAELI
ncbi:hypothetical protein GQ55_2G152800 [Panicum hallii var. hallii]|uniref:Uncharacterized protein n=1 Tax=Panicum hallii var. hallii TaxID=1504633 RepID=A0A2T7EPU3_9POAL|nr:hypothetical protein GQ55_2G152800 [Panicum hallii var. hallii]